jgi:hypothetical protein
MAFEGAGHTAAACKRLELGTSAGSSRGASTGTAGLRSRGADHRHEVRRVTVPPLATMSNTIAICSGRVCTVAVVGWDANRAR